MKMKKVLAIGLSAAMIMSVTPGTVTAADLDADVTVEEFSDDVDMEENILVDEPEVAEGDLDSDQELSDYGIDLFSDGNNVSEEMSVEGDDQEGTWNLEKVNNVRWKEGSTATATWDKVEEANYYRINVYVSYEDCLIGSTETGTESDEIDLQQEIIGILGDLTYNNVRVIFDVQAEKLNEDGTYELGEVSQKSNELIYKINNDKIKLGTPEPSITEKGVVSWEEIEGAYGYNVFYKFEYENLTYTGLLGCISTNKQDMSAEIDSRAAEAGLSGKEIKISIKVNAYVMLDDEKYISGDCSEYSEPVVYSCKNKIKLGTPEPSITEKGIVSWEEIEGAYGYDVFYKFEYENLTYTGLLGCISTNKQDMSAEIDSRAAEAGLSGKEIKVSIKVDAYVMLDDEKYISGDCSEYSEPVMYNVKKKVEKVILSPENMVVAIGNERYFGKTIYPENAYYTDVVWSSADPEIASVDEFGKVIGVSKGKTTIKAMIDDVIAVAEVDVYEIESNIVNDKEKQEVTDASGDIIDDIVNSDIPKLDNTDINQAEALEVKKEIKKAIEDGDSFHTDIKGVEQDFEKYEQNWEKIQIATKNLNAQFLGAYNINLEMYHKDEMGGEHHIGNITELENEVTFTFDLPAGMKEQQDINYKKYVLVRVHKEINGQVEYTPVDYTLNENKTFTAKSNKYSDFVWLLTECNVNDHAWDAGKVTKEATCEEKGSKTYTCTTCGSTKTEDIKALGHKEVKDAAVAATCEKDGLTEGSHCSVCNKVLTEQKKVPATGHAWDAGKVTKEATCEVSGVKTYTCTSCKATKTEDIKALGHKEVKDAAVAATCEKDGLTEGSHCSVCGKVLVAQNVVKATGHSWDAGKVTKEATCEVSGVKTYTCANCKATRTEDTKALGHKAVKDTAVAATCEKDGLTEGSHCSVCNKVLTEQKKVPATGHAWDAGKITKEATCEATGVKTYTCTSCKATKTEDIKALGHKDVKDAAVAATCEKDGLTEGSHCSVCNKVLTEQKKVPATGHKFSSWKTTSQATVFSPEQQSRSCSVCGKNEKREVGSKLQRTMTVSATSLPLKTKQKTTVLKVSGLAAGDSIVSWESSNTKIAKVSGRANGNSTITAGNKKGTAKITITLKSGLQKVVKVTVQKSAVKTKKITGVAKSLKLNKKQKAVLRPVIAPLTSKQKITYKSSNSKVASVNSKGQITAKKKGTAVITVKSGSKTVKCKVTVK